MMMFNDLQFLLTVSSGVLAFLFQFGALMLRIGRAEARIHDRISSVEKDYEVELQKIRNELIASKLDVSNQYVRKDSFNTIMTNLDSRLIRMESKLDRAIEKVG
jgi:hypothetical protein